MLRNSRNRSAFENREHLRHPGARQARGQAARGRRQVRQARQRQGRYERHPRACRVHPAAAHYMRPNEFSNEWRFSRNGSIAVDISISCALVVSIFVALSYQPTCANTSRAPCACALYIGIASAAAMCAALAWHGCCACRSCRRECPRHKKSLFVDVFATAWALAFSNLAKDYTVNWVPEALRTLAAGRVSKAAMDTASGFATSANGSITTNLAKNYAASSSSRATIALSMSAKFHAPGGGAGSCSRSHANKATPTSLHAS